MNRCLLREENVHGVWVRLVRGPILLTGLLGLVQGLFQGGAFFWLLPGDTATPSRGHAAGSGFDRTRTLPPFVGLT